VNNVIKREIKAERRDLLAWMWVGWSLLAPFELVNKQRGE
jgi:hypothetical protein